MRKFSAMIFGLALSLLWVSEAKALITLSINATCAAGSTACIVGVDTVTGIFSYDSASGTVPIFDVTSSADGITYDAATGGPTIFDATSSNPPQDLSPDVFTITFAAPGLPAAANDGDTFTIESVVEMYGALDTNASNLYMGSATVVPLPAALPLFLSSLAILGFAARRRV
jgi:hypothetical protein